MAGITNGACAIKWRSCLLATAAFMLVTTGAALAQPTLVLLDRGRAQSTTHLAATAAGTKIGRDSIAA